MSKKIVERQRLDSFLQSTGRGNFPPPEESESPNFLFRFSDYTLGVEVTSMVSPRVPGGDNPRQSGRVLETLLRAIEQRYAELGGPPAHASVFFRQGLRVPRGALNDLAEELAIALIEAANRARTRFPERQPLEVALRHPAVQNVALWPCNEGEAPRWHFPRGGAVDTAQPEDVKASLDVKEPKLRLYRMQAQEIWLLIVCDLFAEGLLIDPPEEPVSFQVPTGFDRVFCLHWTGSYAVEVPVANSPASHHPRA